MTHYSFGLAGSPVLRPVPIGRSLWGELWPHFLAVTISLVALAASNLAKAYLQRYPLALLYAAVFLSAPLGGTRAGLLSPLLVSLGAAKPIHPDCGTREQPC